jgi:lysophospholipase L1-like esterase
MKRIKIFSDENACNFIDLWGIVSNGNYTDGLHPNINGQKQIAEFIWDNFEKIYKL